LTEETGTVDLYWLGGRKEPDSGNGETSKRIGNGFARKSVMIARALEHQQGGVHDTCVFRAATEKANPYSRERQREDWSRRV